MVLVFLKCLHDVSAAVVSVDGQPVKLQLCDTAGQVSRLYRHTQAEWLHLLLFQPALQTMTAWMIWTDGALYPGCWNAALIRLKNSHKIIWLTIRGCTALWIISYLILPSLFRVSRRLSGRVTVSEVFVKQFFARQEVMFSLGYLKIFQLLVWKKDHYFILGAEIGWNGFMVF